MTTDLNATPTATTTVRIEIAGRPTTIHDLRQALDIFEAEGIPDTLEVQFHQSEERDNSDTDLPWNLRPVTHSAWIQAERAAKQPASSAVREAMRR